MLISALHRRHGGAQDKQRLLRRPDPIEPLADQPFARRDLPTTHFRIGGFPYLLPRNACQRDRARGIGEHHRLYTRDIRIERRSIFRERGRRQQ